MIAPMLGRTTRHCRYFLRLISKNVGFYTEMITTGAVLHNPRYDALLGYHPSEQPLAIQLAGHIPEKLAQVAKIAEDYGYQEINFNVGCPSDKVRSGCFGAVLFKDANLVAECIAAMKKTVRIPLTVKTRIGVDNYESYDYFTQFIQKVNQAGCGTFIIHARKAWLSGLSPKENREIPPLNYQWVYQTKKDFPCLTIVINGGIKSLAEALLHLYHVDGVMIGRAACETPYLLRAIDNFGVFATEATDNCQNDSLREGDSLQDRIVIVQKYVSYAQDAFCRGEAISALLQPLFGLFHGISGARQWRRSLTQAIQRNEGPNIILQKMTEIFTIN